MCLWNYTILFLLKCVSIEIYPFLVWLKYVCTVYGVIPFSFFSQVRRSFIVLVLFCTVYGIIPILFLHQCVYEIIP